MARANTATAPEPPTSIVPAKQVKTMLEASESRLSKVIPAASGLSPGKVVQIVSRLVHATPDLQKCSPESILACVLEGSELGLSFSRSSGEAWLVPFWNKHKGCMEAQFVPGYRGLIKLAYQSGHVALIDARVVRRTDPFRIAYTPDLDFYHEPIFGSPEPVVGVYAFAKLRSGERLVRAMTWDEVLAIKDRSKAKFGPWVTDELEMALKCPIRKIRKMLPACAELDRAFDAEDRVEAALAMMSAAAVPPGTSRTRQLVERLSAQRGIEGPAPEPEFSAGEGVGQPLRSEAEDDGYVPEHFEGDREPGSDG